MKQAEADKRKLVEKLREGNAILEKAEAEKTAMLIQLEREKQNFTQIGQQQKDIKILKWEYL